MSAGYVYLMRREDGLYKIGVSRSPSARRTGVEAATGLTVELLAAAQREDARGVERAIHREYAAVRTRGEWFRLEPGDIPSVIELLHSAAPVPSLAQVRAAARPPRSPVRPRATARATLAERADYTPEEAAALLKIHEQTLRRFLREGKIKGYYIGRVWRIPRASIEEWLETMSNQPPKDVDVE